MNKFFDKKRNQEERFKFVEYWAEYVRTHSDKEWSKQQNMLIDSQIKSANISKKKKIIKRFLYLF